MTADMFNDMMPHRIRVRSNPTLNKNGRKEYTGGYTVYRCLFDDTRSIMRNAQGEFVTFSRVAYANTEGVELTQDDEITFEDGSKRPVVQIQNHYDETGAVHNVTIYFE